MSDQFSAERLNDIEVAITKINRFLSGKFFEEFRDNDMLHDAVLRNLVIISEASSRLSEGTKAKAPKCHGHNGRTLGITLSNPITRSMIVAFRKRLPSGCRCWPPPPGE
jgi:hypothetical protein